MQLSTTLHKSCHRNTVCHAFLRLTSIRSNGCIGYASKLIGYASKLIGYANKLIGYASKLIGYANKLIGYASKLIGYDSKLIGYVSKLRGKLYFTSIRWSLPATWNIQ